MMTLAWGAKVDQQFRDKVAEGCDAYGWSLPHRDWLMACMAFETGETFSPSVRNAAGSGAVGLIQFMPATAKGLGTSTQELERMGAVEQLDVVFEYFYPYRTRIASLSDMYMAILLPKYVGKSDASVLFSGGIAYRQNSGLDADKNGQITKREATAKVEAKLRRGLQPGNVWSSSK